MRFGYVYFARPVLDGIAPIKIGWSKNPWCTVREAKRWAWFDFELVATVGVDFKPLAGTGFDSLEQTIHRALQADRIRREWFRPTDRVLCIVEHANHGADDLLIAETIYPWLSLGEQRRRAGARALWAQKAGVA